jgi:hypothetical protein
MLTHPDRTGQPARETTPAITGSVPWLTDSRARLT